MNNNKLPNVFVISMFPSVSLRNEQILRNFFEILERFNLFTPTHWGHDERIRLNYDREEVIEKIIREKFSELHLHRTSSVEYSGYFNLNVSFNSFLQMKFKSIPKNMWSQFFELSDCLAAEIHPRFGITHMFWPSVIPWQNERQRLHRWMNFSAQTAPVNFGPVGPLGLGNRTYFGNEMIQLFGKEVLHEAPASIKDLAWGGLRIDVVDPLWGASPDELLDSWLVAMEYFKTTELLAIPIFNINDKRTITFNPNNRWIRFIQNYTFKQN